MAEADIGRAATCVQCACNFLQTGKGRPRARCYECSPFRPGQRVGKRTMPRNCIGCGVALPSAYFKRCASCNSEHYKGYHIRRARARGVRPRAEMIERSREGSVRYSGLKCRSCGEGFVPKRTDRLTYCSRRCAASDQNRTAALARARRDRWAPIFESRRALAEETKALRSIAKGMQASIKRCLALRERRARAMQPCEHCGSAVGSRAIKRGGSGVRFCSPACYRKSDVRRDAKRMARVARKARMRCVQVEAVDPIKVFERDGWRCHLCGGKTIRARRGTYHPKAPELDHIVPLAKGGEHSYRNTACAHRSCNIAKSDDIVGQPSLLPA